MRGRRSSISAGRVMARLFACGQGHRWEVPVEAAGTLPAGSEVCPVCGGAGETLSDAPAAPAPPQGETMPLPASGPPDATPAPPPAQVFAFDSVDEEDPTRRGAEVPEGRWERVVVQAAKRAEV